MTAPNILILGHGEMGHAMEYLLSNQRELYIWERNPKGKTKPIVVEDAVALADIIIFCLPVNPHRNIIKKIQPFLKPDSCCLSIAKGLDENGQTASQIFSDVLGNQHDYALLYGPMISEEILAGRFAFAQLASHDKSAIEKILPLFADSRLYIEFNQDINGINWAVILKNIYAILFGIADELQLGDNMRGFLAAVSLREMDNVIVRLGGKPGSCYNFAGLGDLITTATSEGSHHHSLGRRLARGETSDIGGEGVHTLAMINKHRLFDIESYPLSKLVTDAIEAPEKLKEKIEKYLKQRFY